MEAKYINPYTDFGFKKLFAEEGNKDLLIDFLNQLLPPHHQIANLSFHNPENLADLPQERKAIFDIYCKAVSGEHFIVELQKARKQMGDKSQQFSKMDQVVRELRSREREQRQRRIRKR